MARFFKHVYKPEQKSRRLVESSTGQYRAQTRLADETFARCAVNREKNVAIGEILSQKSLHCCKYYNNMSNKLEQGRNRVIVVIITSIKLNKSIDFLNFLC